MTPSLKGVFEVFGTNASGKIPSYQYEESFSKWLQHFNFYSLLLANSARALMPAIDSNSAIRFMAIS